MKIRELLEAIEPEKKSTSALASAPSIDDELDKVDDEKSEEDESEEDIDLGDLASYAGDIGDDLWSVSSLKYDSLGTAENKKSVISQLTKTAKTLPELKHSISTLKTANGRDGAVSTIIINGLTGNSAVFHVEAGTEPRIMPESFLDELETNQAVKMNKIIDAGSRYSKALTKYFENPDDDYDAYAAAESRQDRLLWALNYEGQKFPTGKLSPAVQDAIEWNKKRKAEREARRGNRVNSDEGQ